MKRIIERPITIAAIAVLLLTTIAATASPAKAGGKRFQIYGRVLKIDREARMLLVADRWSEKEYLVYMPEGATVRFAIQFRTRVSTPEFKDLYKNDYIIAHVRRTDTEHLSRLGGGREVVVPSVAK